MTSTSTSPAKPNKWMWWKRRNSPKPNHPASAPSTGGRAYGIFGVPLTESINYARMTISYIEGHDYSYGYIPIIVAKCGSFLKDQAVYVEGIFRVSGSAKRIGELQQIFDTPPSYGSTLDWKGYSVHDAANVLRRFCNYLPEPIIPHSYYHEFRNVMLEDLTSDQRIEKFQLLIEHIPLSHQFMLLYLLDMLAIFAAHSHANRMDSQNLASVFQPGLLSHPDDEMAPHTYRLSQRVIAFLIENHTSFSIPQGSKLMRSSSLRPNPLAPMVPSVRAGQAAAPEYPSAVPSLNVGAAPAKRRAPTDPLKDPPPSKSTQGGVAFASARAPFTGSIPPIPSPAATAPSASKEPVHRPSVEVARSKTLPIKRRYGGADPMQVVVVGRSRK
ncbi:uncharacterized protein VTP21DRAFT_10985 [Calcarisporiella thermophila]|uniref:uncharacterized protein n=1 Tax=Calcarisporiella thermophila TaxID=911321 RepID=UPI003743577B